MAPEAAQESKEERMLFGGMARWDGLDLFGPSYMSVAYRKEGTVRILIEPSRVWRPESPLLKLLTRLPVTRSVFFWGRLLVQLLGSVRTLVFFAVTLAALWGLVLLLDFGGGALGGALGLLAQFPVLPLLALFFAVMKLTSIGRYHGAEHKSVAAYENYGEVTLEGAKKSSRLHPRCGTNILIYILIAALIAPFVDWWGYTILQFILISEAWFIFGQSRPSVAVGNLLQRFFTTNEPRRAELEVAVESLNHLIQAEKDQRGGDLQVQARF